MKALKGEFYFCFTSLSTLMAVFSMGIIVNLTTVIFAVHSRSDATRKQLLSVRRPQPHPGGIEIKRCD